MLESNFIVKMENGEQIRIANVDCYHCKNIFFVPNIGENEPSFCAYCGIKFIKYTKGDDEQEYNLAGFKIP